MNVVIRPNPGPQEEFLSTSADIAIYGGAAGAGKSYALLLEPLRWKDLQGFESVTFRRQSVQITAGGGLWDTSQTLYPKFGGIPKQSPRYHWVFKSGAKIAFDHLQFEKSVSSWDGSQLALINFDELQHFSETQFFYMFGRNRTMCGVKPYIRAPCNPDPDSFLLNLLDWYLDKEGYPIPERSGKIRYLLRWKGEVHWFNTMRELRKVFPDETKHRPRSFTFISAKLSDNPELTKVNPDYQANLDAMFEYERKRLAEGNWLARPSAGELFKTFYWKFLDDVPSKMVKVVRYWDKAGTTPNESNPDPDWTSGTKIGIDRDRRIIILDQVRFRMEPGDVERKIQEYAERDGVGVEIWLEQDPGSAGKAEALYYLKALLGYNVRFNPKRSNKLSFWGPFASQVKQGNVYLVRSSWNDAYINEMAGVTDGTQPGHDDQADSSSGGFMVLANFLRDEAVGSALQNMGSI